MDITFQLQLCSIVGVLIFTYILLNWHNFNRKLLSYRIRKFKNNLKHDWVTDGKSIESSTILNDENEFDSHAIYGFDTRGNSLVTRINKRGSEITEIWLQLRLSDGTIYQLPVHPNTSITRQKSTWSVNGLKFTILEPFIRIRVTFNGLLRNCTQNGTNSEEINHVKFNFIWTSCAKPFDWPLDQSTSLLSDVISLESNLNEQCMKPSVSGYDQYGVLYGEVFLNGTSIELNLPSLRSRRKGNDIHELRDQFELIGVCEDGVLFQIGITSSKNLIHFKYGTIRTMSGITHPLTQSDLSVELMGTSIENIQKMFVVNFKVNGQNHNNIFYLQTAATTKMYGGNPCNFESNIIPFNCCFSSESGNGLAIIEYKHKGPTNQSPIIPRNYLSFYDIQDTVNDCLIVRFNEKLCEAVSMVGGKGASLSLMSSIQTSEFIVPEGCCLTKYALQRQLQISDLELLVREIEKYTLKDLKELESACNMVEKRISETAIDETIAKSVKIHLNELRKKSVELYDQETCRFAVRSSGLNEDSEESSAAGQNETVLGCLTDEDVLDAILKCWASLFAFRSVAYRRQHGQAVNCGMGVVIQIMVPSEVSGVMFTCHPTTQNPSQILITASYGLGESVVSAAVHPDQFIVEKTWDDQIDIQSRQIGDKATQIIMSENSTSTVNIDYSRAQILCMSDDEILTVAKIGILLQNLFDYYCDVEWAIYKNKLYILQCRAITTTNKWTDFEIIHEFDFPIISNYELTTFANCIEVCPKPISTLTFSTLPYRFNKCQHKFKGHKDLHRYYGSAMFSQRIALHIFWTFLADLVNEVKIQHRVSCISVLGEDIVNDKIHKIAVKMNSRNNPNKTTIWIIILQAMWQFSKNFEFTKKLSENFKLDFNHVNNSKDLHHLILKSLHGLDEFTTYHMMGSGGSSLFKIWIMMTLLGSSKEITQDHLNDFTKILSLENNVLSGEIPKRLRKVSNLIARSGKSKEFQQLSTKECLQWLQKNVSEAEKQLQEILKEHGHRGIMEFDLYHEPWILNPTPLIEALQSTSHMDISNTERGEVKMENVINNLKTSKTFIQKLILKYLIPKLQTSIRNREFTKSAVILVTHKFRLAFRHLGYLLEKEGKLPNANLIFFLTKYELNELIHEHKTELIEKACRRLKLYPQLNKITYEEYNYGRPKPIPDSISTNIDLDSDCTLKGTAVFPGIVQNRACVITDISQAHLIQPNDILITTATDVGWSPYFPMISGLVTEIGGLISHGAVIAREYGIPCVIGVKGATKMFATDNQVILDANNGSISKN